MLLEMRNSPWIIPLDQSWLSTPLETKRMMLVEGSCLYEHLGLKG
jgi:hypothetical protein